MNPRKILAIVALMVVGSGIFLFYALVDDDAKNDLPKIKIGENTFHLASEKEMILWETDHIASIVELRLTPFLLSAIQEKKKNQLNRLLKDSAILSVSKKQTSFVLNPNRSKIKNDISHPDTNIQNREEFVAFLTNLYGEIKTANYVKILLLSVEKINDSPNRWRVGFRFVVDGAGQDQLLHHLSSDHLIELDILDEKKITEDRGISRWSVVDIEKYQTETFFFEEATNEYKLNEIILFDDWIYQEQMNKNRKTGDELKKEKVKAFDSQISVIDFDNDGFPDLVVATPNGVPMLYRNNSNNGFQNITPDSGLTNWNTDVGTQKNLCSWIDYNNDGLPDLLLGNSFFRNDGAGKFTNITAKSGITIQHGCSGAVVADYDCDGFQDIYLIYDSFDTSSIHEESWVSTNSIYKRNVLLHNERNGNFLDVSLTSHSDGGQTATRSAAWFHYNEDKFPDLVLANYLDESEILVNNGDGTFKQLSAEEGISPFGFNTGVSVGDFDNDGISEIFVNGCYSVPGIRQLELLSPNDYAQGTYNRLQRMVRGNFLFKKNSRKGRYSDQAKKWQVDRTGFGFGSTLIDIQNDGWLDVYATAGLKSFNRFEIDGAANWWKGILISPEFRYSKIYPPKSIEKKFDLDLGEFWVINPFLIPAYRKNLFSYQRNRFFLNERGKNFVDATFASHADIDSDSRSAIAADFNRDGASDLLVSSVGGGPLRLFLNRLPQQNRIRLDLTGVESNQMAVGSKLIVHCADRKIYREFFPANGFQGTGSSELLIGVGKAKKIDKLEIRWPNGKKQEFLNLPVNKIISLTEGIETFQSAPFRKNKILK